MEEVVGSIPTRSTKYLNKLDGANSYRNGFCVMVCVITRRFGAHSKGFHRCSLRFHPHVAVPLQHPTAHMSGNRHDGGIRRTVLRKLGDSAVPQIVEPEPRQSGLLRQRSPG
jgi:hypothetical protein